jgi:hypothetical protein
MANPAARVRLLRLGVCGFRTVRRNRAFGQTVKGGRIPREPTSRRSSVARHGHFTPFAPNFVK